MANPSTVKVSYLGTNVGKIYLSDCGKRLGLGGAQEGNYYGGQDEYIIWGEIKVLDATTDVLTSLSSGILAHFSDTHNTDWNTKNGPPLTTDYGTHTKIEEKPSAQFMTGSGGACGGTGLDYMWSDDYLSRLANDKYAPTATAGATGYYYGNAI
jgi:hypothetical protein